MNNFITYKLAKSLEKLGFKEECLATIDQTEYIHINKTKRVIRGSMCYDEVPCPTWEQAFDFFRDYYNLTSHIDIYRKDEKVTKYYYQISNFTSKFSLHEYIRYIDSETIQQARINCLTKLINYKHDR